MSDEIVSGVQPPGIATSATVKSKLPPPWPTSNITPRCLAASARQQLAVLHDVGEGPGDVRYAGIGVGEHIAGTQQIENLRHQFLVLDTADMDHHLRWPAAHLAA